jgi:hypothetical protein
MKTHWKKLTNPDYLGSYDFQPGEERTVKILQVEQKPVKGPDGKEELCIVAHLANQKPVILNKTNCKTISNLYKTAYIEDWSGKSIILKVEAVKAFGEVVDALRVKKQIPKLPELTPQHPKFSEIQQKLKAGAGSIAQLEQSFTINPETRKLLCQE